MPEPMIAATMRMARFTMPVAEQVVLNNPFAVAAVAQPIVLEQMATPELAFNPALLGQIVATPPMTVFIPPVETPGYDRAAATRPIVDAPAPVDTSLFTSPDGATTYFLPRYSLKRVSNDRYDISITQAEGGDFRFAVGFDRTPPSDMVVPPGAQELPHVAAALVSFTNGQGTQVELPLTEAIHDENGRLIGGAARLPIETRESLVHSIGQVGQARLIVRRQIAVAAQIAPAGIEAAPVQFRLARKMRHRMLTKRSAMQIAAHFQNTGEDLLDEPVQELAAEPAAQPAPPALRYQNVDLVLEQVAAPNPLFLSPTLHPYFYAGGPAVAERVAQKRITIPYAEGSARERHFPYFQSSQDASVFYYLPDGYRLARKETEPFSPEMRVWLSTPDGSLESATAIIDYVVRAHVSPERLEAASRQLVTELPPTLAANGAQPKLRPLAAFPKYRMRIPGSAGVEMAEFEGVNIDIANGFKHTLKVTLAEFQQLFASALSNDATSLFTGEVLVETGGPSPDAVQVDIRFARTEGPLIDTIETTVADGGVDVRMRNGTESALSVRSLPVSLIRSGVIGNGRIDGLDLSQPFLLAAGQSVDFKVLPTNPMTGEGQVDVIFDLDGIDVMPDPTSMLATIRDRSVPAAYVRDINVMTLQTLLDHNPDDPVLLINVEFKTGDAVRLTRDALEISAAVHLPLVNMLLGQDSKGVYQYRQTIVHTSGTQVIDDVWRESDHDLLIVPVKS